MTRPAISLVPMVILTALVGLCTDAQAMERRGCAKVVVARPTAHLGLILTERTETVRWAWRQALNRQDLYKIAPVTLKHLVHLGQDALQLVQDAKRFKKVDTGMAAFALHPFEAIQGGLHDPFFATLSTGVKGFQPLMQAIEDKQVFKHRIDKANSELATAVLKVKQKALEQFGPVIDKTLGGDRVETMLRTFELEYADAMPVVKPAEGNLRRIVEAQTKLAAEKSQEPRFTAFKKAIDNFDLVGRLTDNSCFEAGVGLSAIRHHDGMISEISGFATEGFAIAVGATRETPQGVAHRNTLLLADPSGIFHATRLAQGDLEVSTMNPPSGGDPNAEMTFKTLFTAQKE